MLETILALYRKYREALLYLFFGGLTTVVNYVVYIGAYYLLPFTTTTLPNLLAWVAAVLFAYLTNRTWVFHSEAAGAAAIGREIAAFAGARVVTLLMETAILWLAVDMLHFPNLLVKLLGNVLVVILNYVFSKFWIFKKEKTE